MNLSPLPLTTVVGAFLLAFPALFSIVNPLGASLTFHQVTEGRADRHILAWRIALYALLILLGSLLLGSYILGFFGVSLGALRVAGGLVVAIRAWSLLMDPQVQEKAPILTSFSNSSRGTTQSLTRRTLLVQTISSVLPRLLVILWLLFSMMVILAVYLTIAS